MDHVSCLGLASELVEWYWRHGAARRAPYALGPSDWLRSLYDTRASLGAVNEGLRRPRPAMAIWGPSQTGKSTSVSAYIDAAARFAKDQPGGDPATDGSGSGLHWPGGVPFFFMAPRVENVDELPPHLTGRVLNPFNKGMDGSSCLSRFVPGSLEEGREACHVADPMHPVEVFLVSPEDLWHAMARGFSTECVTKAGRRPEPWNLDRFRAALKSFLQQRAAEKPRATVRAAYERLHAFAGVIDDLAQSDDPTFEALAADREAWQAALRSLFEEPRLASDPALVEDFAARVFWEGMPKMTEWYRRMVETWQRLSGPGGRWHGKRVLCSLEAAGVFLNMGACAVAYKPRESNPNSPVAILQDRIAKLSFEVDGDRVRIGCTGRGELLGGTPDDFSILQGLVWELVVPINMANLPDRPFAAQGAPERPNTLREFLAVADLLDFPGVGNETKAIENRIVLDDADIRDLEAKAASPTATPQDRERATRCFSAPLLFKEIVKRGKTASIVSTYAKRLSIDGFSVFQGLRGYACPNADQLINGIKSWWKNLAPDYFEDPQGESPYPLDLVLTWWARQLNLATNPNDTNIYGVIEGIVNNLGRIKEPDVCTTFAIHDHNSPDRDQAELKADFSPGSVRYENLHREKAFARQFQREISRTSFDAMLSDRITGGAEFFFGVARGQMLRCRAAGARSRIDFLRARAAEAVQRVHQLVATRDLVPQPKPRDDRREHLERFREGLRDAVHRADERALLKINLALRDFLNVRATDLLPVPRSAEEIGPSHIEAQYRTWVEKQSQRFEADSDTGALCRRIGMADQNLVRQTALALAQSLSPDFAQIATWLAGLVRHHEGRERPDFTRLLALAMGNALVRGSNRRRREIDEDAFDDGARPGARPVSTYRDFFLEPFAGDKGQLDQLIRREVRPQKRPDQPGDAEIVAVLKRFEIDPAANAGASGPHA
jgi:hypothetical protein